MGGSLGFPGEELTALHFLRVRSACGSGGVCASVHVCACASEAVVSLRRRGVAMAGPPGAGPRLLGLCGSSAPLYCRPLSPRRGLKRPSPQGLELSQPVLSCLTALVQVNARVRSAACGAQSTAEMRAPPPLPWAPVPTCTRPVRSGPGWPRGQLAGPLPLPKAPVISPRFLPWSRCQSLLHSRERLSGDPEA